MCIRDRRKTDPRYSIQRDFSLKHMADDPIFKYADLLYKVVPPILKEQGKAKNPWPNLDAQTGVIQWHYGVREYDFYTVLFAVGRSIGIAVNLVWDRALNFSLERPKSLTTEMLEAIANGEDLNIPDEQHMLKQKIGCRDFMAAYFFCASCKGNVAICVNNLLLSDWNSDCLLFVQRF
eukprot:TRINITY_DN6659_c0_g1_i1.p1 TRINITY_DN6659_c0_g1~~TRINITY_DN6659_c0_g1_i1.p1  ORF type:complete len:178 (+),score=6.81 TRINITY_DN6659_c0_g1_i1:186-719(+)